MTSEAIVSIIQSLLIGAVGGLSAYWLAQRRFVSERSWERRYELYGEIFDQLHNIECALLRLECCLSEDKQCRECSDVPDSVKTYRASLVRLGQLQERLLLLNAQDIHVRVVTIYAALGTFDPGLVLNRDSLSKEEAQELIESVRWLKRETSGRNGEIALNASEDLRLSTGTIGRWRQRRKARARLKALEKVSEKAKEC